MFDTDDITERFVLVAVDVGEVDAAGRGLDELAELVATAGGAVAGRLVQKRETAHPGHYMGKGKLSELESLISLTNATGIVCDDELTSAQQKNMAAALNTKVMDRTAVILDIFARHAGTGEAKAQVELAQLRYSLSRLAGHGAQMSRLGGGIGTRGPGEKKLETDRRRIKERIAELGAELKDIETHREEQRKKRQRTAIPVVSLVGYTNAGKSSLLNALSGAGVPTENKLFATLDTTTRRAALPGGTVVLFTDTVGFIQKLPHHLVQAFRATLEELRHADILIHVVDAGSPAREEQMAVVYSTLDKLGCAGKPVITAFNKMDLDVALPLPADRRAVQTVALSALRPESATPLAAAVEDEINRLRQKMSVLIPYAESAALNFIYGNCEVLDSEHEAEGTRLEIYGDGEAARRLARFVR